MAEFHKLIANVRDALERRAAPAHNGAAEAAKAVPTYKAARRVELASQFARELEAVGGHYLGTVTPKEMVARVRGVAAALNAQSVAVGTGLVTDPAPMVEALQLAGITVFRTAAVADDAGARGIAWQARAMRFCGGRSRLRDRRNRDARDGRDA